MEIAILNGPLEGKRFPMEKASVTIGRKADNDVTISTDPRISRFHAQLTRHDETTWIIEDLNSANGTFVGQRRIQAPTALHPNDQFRMGRTWMTLHYEAETADEMFTAGTVRIGDRSSSAAEIDSVVYPVSAENDAADSGDTEGIREYLWVYQRVSRALSSTLDAAQLGTVIVDAIMECVPAERAFLLLRDPDSGQLTPRISRQRTDSPTTGQTVTISRHIVERAMNERVAILTTDAMTDKRFQELDSVQNFQIRSAVCAPLIHQDDVLGVIYLDTTSARHVFSEDDVYMTASVASQAAVAFENAQLYTDLRNAYNHLKAAQDQLVSSEKLSTIGTLSATVAHDMINIVMPLQPLIDIMLRNADVDPENEEAVRRQTQRLMTLAERLMSFSAAEDVSLVPTNINDVVRSTLSLIKTEFNHRGVELVTEFDESLPMVMADEAQIDRVFLNLCMNALEAMDDTPDPIMHIRSYRDRDEAVITVADNGPGIPADAEDIFEPFFTTKKTGTGLGLFSCRRIVQDDHHGVIEYQSAPGQGTTFTVRLPVPDSD